MTRRRMVNGARMLAVVAGAVALLAVALPSVSGIDWRPIAAAVAHVPGRDLALLGVLWASGLVLHTFTLTAALPRLTHRRALTLSLTGSAVANVLPLGGAAGIALNYRMVRAWGFGPRDFATYTLVTNVWDVLVKLCLPVIALSWLLANGEVVAGPIVTATVVATSLLALLSATLVVTLLSRRVTAAAGAIADLALLPVLRRVGSTRRPDVAARLLLVREQCASVVRRGWARLTGGMLAYTATLAVLLWGCLTVSGAGLPVAAVFAGFALERVLTLAGLTPGGAGVVEVGLAGLLLLLGGDPLGVVAGTVLYRAFTFGLEIPVGGVGLVGWLWLHRQPPAGSGESAAT
ncbi:flippase-like domain-containing protein [Nocardioides sp. KIGAM211]|uniref:Flippase-like domain-containing protein n=1 Tax=Nocardioides luti TaxID=2761101 RepID=A0A7X0RM68_9ACTN|nr:lysylphosphatidylglycerol synthase domain-containing protein [Nocardioides luti]MBB6629750.1 flippase-like domain-containing protein [Nocardioides luti]